MKDAEKFFEEHPRPWEVGVRDRGLGHKDFSVLDQSGELVVEAPDRETAETIVVSMNEYQT